MRPGAKTLPQPGRGTETLEELHQNLLDDGKIETLVCAFRGIDSSYPEVVGKIRIEAAYFENHTERMRSALSTCSSAPASSKLDARHGSARAASSRECSGPFGVPMPSWLCVAGRFDDYREARRA
jgi:hypothetical protein